MLENSLNFFLLRFGHLSFCSLLSLGFLQSAPNYSGSLSMSMYMCVYVCMESVFGKLVLPPLKVVSKFKFLGSNPLVD